MIDGDVIIDGVVHAYNYVPDNVVPTARWDVQAGMLYALHMAFTPPAEAARWQLTQDELCTPNVPMLADALFAESPIDACIYHSLPIFSCFKDGGAPIALGRQLRELAPGRVFIYAGLSPFRPDAKDEIDRLIDEDRIVGLKFYPQDLVSGRIVGFRWDDEKLMFPLLEHAQKRGLKTVAMHKAMPFGATGHEFFEVRDVGPVASAFPGLNFEIFHGGFAFLEDTVMQLLYNPNVTVNLEGTGGLIVNAPLKFARILGEFLAIGAWDRIVWGTGAPVQHPKLLLDAFLKFQIPDELCAGYGYPKLTAEMRRAMLGQTQARICGLDLDVIRHVASTDRYAALGGRQVPWTRRVAA